MKIRQLNLIEREKHLYNRALNLTIGLEVAAIIIGVNWILDLLAGIPLTSKESILKGLIFIVLSLVNFIDHLIIERRFVKTNKPK